VVRRCKGESEVATAPTENHAGVVVEFGGEGDGEKIAVGLGVDFDRTVSNHHLGV